MGPRPALDPIPVHEDDIQDLSLLIRSHHPLIFVEGQDVSAVRSLLEAVAQGLNIPLLTWTGHEGLVRSRGLSGAEGTASLDAGVYKTEKPAACLAHLKSADAENLTFLSGFEPFLAESEVQSRLLQLHDQLIRHRGAIVLSGSPQALPENLSSLFTVIRQRTPPREAYHAYVTRLLVEVRQRMPVQVDLTPQDVAELIEHLHGMPFHEVRKIVTQSITSDGRLTRSDLSAVLEAKRRVIQRAGMLEYVSVDVGGAPVAGLSRLQTWLEKRRLAFTEPARARELGLPSPRGLLLTGVQGCGKSLAARVISAKFGLPLLRMDPGTLYRKYFGESEANMRSALQAAEQVSPCILWIDEIEKAFGGGDSDGGTSRRILGTFLTWLQDKQAPVFVFATANDISELPPELLRKGRFDEIFFVDLPGHEVRQHIFALHLARRKQDPAKFDLQQLASKSQGFSGAEIEQALISGLYSALSLDRQLDTGLLLQELIETQPLSVTMAEKVQALRAWAQERAVFVDPAGGE
jgi:MoxR-like ATPase